MHNLSTGSIKNVLCLGAHADDIEIGCGGTILSLLAENPEIRVCWVVLSATGARSDEAMLSAESFLAAAAEKNIIIKNFRDSYFPCETESLKDFLHDLSVEFSPDVIFTHRRDDLHQDHRLVSELTSCAFRDHLVLEYEIPKYDGDLGRSNIFIPLDEFICERKVASIVEHFPSQHVKPWFSEDTFLAMLRIRGVECASRLAEAFDCRKMTLTTSLLSAPSPRSVRKQSQSPVQELLQTEPVSKCKFPAILEPEKR